MWLGTLFLMFSALLVTDLFTRGGPLFTEETPQLRGVALLLAGMLSAIGIVQGPPATVVSDHEIRLAGLPAERDGLTLVAISDLRR